MFSVPNMGKTHWSAMCMISGSSALSGTEQSAQAGSWLVHPRSSFHRANHLRGNSYGQSLALVLQDPAAMALVDTCHREMPRRPNFGTTQIHVTNLGIDHLAPLEFVSSTKFLSTVLSATG